MTTISNLKNIQNYDPPYLYRESTFEAFGDLAFKFGIYSHLETVQSQIDSADGWMPEFSSSNHYQTPFLKGSARSPGSQTGVPIKMNFVRDQTIPFSGGGDSHIEFKADSTRRLQS